MPKAITEKGEITRLRALYKNLPPNRYKLADGLIVQAARLRVRLNNLWKDIQENGEFEMFTQTANAAPYMRERPASKTFTATDKSYQAIIKQLDAMLPAETSAGKLAELMNDD